GAYTFGNLLPGNYTVTETPPSGFLPGTGNTGSSSVTLAAGANVTGTNFSEVPPASVSGTVFSDTNNNGVQNTGESGISGVTVTLPGTPPPGPPVTPTTTPNSTGSYSFTNLLPGSYTVTETPPAGYLPGTGDTGSGTVSVSAGSNTTGPSFSEVPPASVSGTVFKIGSATCSESTEASGVGGGTHTP